MTIATFIDRFLHLDRFTTEEGLKKSRLFVKACLLTSLFSTTYIWLSIYFGYDRGVYLMLFNVVGFILLALLVKTKLPIVWLGNVYVFFGAFAIYVLTYYSGGVWSAIYPWIVSIPILAMLVVNKFSGGFWGVVSFGVMIWFALLAYNEIELPIEYNFEQRTLWYITVLPGLLLIILFISFVFEDMQSKSLMILTKKNEQLNIQKETISKQSDRLTNLLEEKNTIIRILAHDLRNPLKNITSLVDLMEIENDESMKKQYVGMINDGSLKAQHLVNRVLEMDASNQEDVELHLEEVEVKEYLNLIINSMKISAESKNIVLKLIDNSYNTVVMADRTYLELIFENLLSNAIKFSEKNTTVTIFIENDGNKVRIKVSDQGPGISKEEQGKLFQKFSKLSARPTAGESSTGLGLSLVKRYVELIDGEIWFESNEEKGSTFVVVLKAEKTKIPV
ncbi:MAG TPA: HAMP domain-containing sensor histidine kinase [Fulvivirga sp.]|nr:HAMP domain-containing sensor histidine kinase [Fulvivirga sp.]